jgi:DNA repair ATPase RecN
MHSFLYHYKVKYRNNLEDLTLVINEVNRLLPQLSDFITQFNQVIIATGVNVTTDSVGNLGMDAPGEMTSAEMQRISNRIGIMDRLINNHGSTVNELLQRGQSIERDITSLNPGYQSQLVEKINRFKELNASYNH